MTNKQQHTPGPWTVQIIGMRGSFHIPQAQKHEAAHSGDGVDGYTVSKANARLIAAAPDMLAALQEVMNEWREDYGLRCEQQIRAAIAKAIGTQT